MFRLVPTDDGLREASPQKSDPVEERSRWTVPLEELERVVGSESPVSAATEARRNVYRRSEALKVLVRRRASGHCEGCGEEAPFLDLKGRPYLEPHHLTRIVDGGLDRPDHVIALCPNCHRRVHSGADGEAYNSELKARLERIVAATET